MPTSYQSKYFRDQSLTRNLVCSILKILNDKVFLAIPEWDSNIELKLFYSTSGDERYLYESSPSTLILCKAETLYQTVPRGVLDVNSFKIEESWLSNKRIRLTQVLHENIENGIEELNTYSIEANLVPIVLDLTLNIVANSNVESMMLGESILKTFYKFQKFYISYNGFRLSSILSIPDSYELAKPIDFGFSDRKEFKLDLNLRCDSFLPILFEETRLLNSQRMIDIKINENIF